MEKIILIEFMSNKEAPGVELEKAQSFLEERNYCGIFLTGLLRGEQVESIANIMSERGDIIAITTFDNSLLNDSAEIYCIGTRSKYWFSQLFTNHYPKSIHDFKEPLGFSANVERINSDIKSVLKKYLELESGIIIIQQPTKDLKNYILDINNWNILEDTTEVLQTKNNESSRSNFDPYRELTDYENQLYFDKKTTSIMFNNRPLKITFNTIPYFLCLYIFNEPGKFFAEKSILEAFQSRTGNSYNGTKKRSLRSAVDKLNKKLSEEFNIEKIVTYCKQGAKIEESFKYRGGDARCLSIQEVESRKDLANQLINNIWITD